MLARRRLDRLTLYAQGTVAGAMLVQTSQREVSHNEVEAEKDEDPQVWRHRQTTNIGGAKLHVHSLNMNARSRRESMCCSSVTVC